MFCQRFGPLLASTLLLVLGCVGSAHADVPTLESLAQRIDALERQNADLQEKVRRLESSQGPRPEVQVAQAPAGRAEWAESTTVSSYGEVGYNRPSQASDAATVDVQRAVIALQHRFDDQTRMVGEWEWEHAITSADDRGEAEVEQLWVEHEFNNGLRARAGLFLMPFGLINQNHEPTAYYGVFRDQVERVIIPSTWREVGISLSGTTAAALSWEIGLTSGFNLTKWDPASADGREAGPLQAIHGEGQFAAARDLSGYAALNWRGYPGLQVGAALFTGKVGQQSPGFAGNDSRLVLADAHARYTIAGWDFSGVYARGTISRTEALNQGFLASTEAPTLVPSLFEGGYLQAAYKLWHNDRLALNPFLRYEQYNDAAAFGTLSAADGAVVMPDDRVWTLGASLYVTNGVVLKLDYQHNLAYSNKNGLNLGVGYSF